MCDVDPLGDDPGGSSASWEHVCTVAPLIIVVVAATERSSSSFPGGIPRGGAEASRGLLHPALFPDVRDGLSEASKHSFKAIIETPPVRASVRTPGAMHNG